MKIEGLNLGALLVLGRLLYGAVLLEPQQVLLDSLQRVREAAILQLYHLQTNPLQQGTRQTLILLLLSVCIHHLPDNLRVHKTI